MTCLGRLTFSTRVIGMRHHTQSVSCLTDPRLLMTPSERGGHINRGSEVSLGASCLRGRRFLRTLRMSWLDGVKGALSCVFEFTSSLWDWSTRCRMSLLRWRAGYGAGRRS